jgi:XrtJ-associated TM-motif-TM protein
LKIIRHMPSAVIAFLLFTAAAHAQNGCINSPENPTAVLALVGTAAVIIRNKFNR